MNGLTICYAGIQNPCVTCGQFAMVQQLHCTTVTCFPLMVVIFRLLITTSGLCVTTFRHKIYGKKFINYAFNGKIVTDKTAIINNTKMIYYY